MHIPNVECSSNIKLNFVRLQVGFWRRRYQNHQGWQRVVA